MSYVSLYRKYRSQTFGDLVGQDHVVRTLQSAIASGRIAQSYLFTGPRGTGKTSTARLLAKALCCERGPSTEPCNECPLCTGIQEGSCMDVLEMDAASEAGVEQVREAIISVTEYRPLQARYKVFIIDEVHDLSAKAFDALLKTIEEPPPHVVFILATTEFNKVPPTIRSRCQKFEFHRASLSDLCRRIEHVAAAEGVAIEPAAVRAIARMADGGFRDALTLLEQAMMTAEGTITLQHVYDQLGLIADEVSDRILLAIRAGDVETILRETDSVAKLGRDPKSIVESLLHRLADLTRAAYGVSTTEGEAAQDAALQATFAQLDLDTVLQLRAELSDVLRALRDISIPRLWLDSQLVRLAIGRRTRPMGPDVRKPPTEAIVAHQPAPAPAPAIPSRQPSAEQEPPETPGQGTEERSRAERVWSQVVRVLSEQSRSMRLHLEQTRVATVNGNCVTVEFERTFDLDWVRGAPKRESALRAEFGKLWPGVELSMVAGARKPTGDETGVGPVELPLEGPELVQKVRQILRGPNDPGKNRGDA